MGERAHKIMQLAMHKRESDSNLTKYVTQGEKNIFADVRVDFHDTQNENKVLEITPGPKLLDISYNYVSAQDNSNTVVSIAPSKPYDVETSTEANFRNESKPQAVPDTYTTNVDDSPYVEEPFQDCGSSYAPSEEYGSDSTSDAMEKASDEEQEKSYENFEEMLLDNYDSKEVWDQLSAQLSRRNKSTTETMAEFLEQKGVFARRLKLDDELHLPQLVDMFGPAVLHYLQVSKPVPPTHETREEKIVIPENNAEVNDVSEMDEEAESHANSESDELAAAAEEVEILGNDADAEADVVRDKEINIDPEEDETVEEEIIGEEYSTKLPV
ncbi:hypothetical protein FQA39_LY04988 [Lamprigera yunnana]|nr:hypothetical protein FQA39_LY04988 [Lamprigera yunnana]